MTIHVSLILSFRIYSRTQHARPPFLPIPDRRGLCTERGGSSSSRGFFAAEGRAWNGNMKWEHVRTTPCPLLLFAYSRNGCIITQLDRHNAIIRTTGRSHHSLNRTCGALFGHGANKGSFTLVPSLGKKSTFWLCVLCVGAYIFLFYFSQKIGRKVSCFWSLPQ
jgi:hypothetical protein